MTKDMTTEDMHEVSVAASHEQAAAEPEQRWRVHDLQEARPDPPAVTARPRPLCVPDPARPSAAPSCVGELGPRLQQRGGGWVPGGIGLGQVLHTASGDQQGFDQGTAQCQGTGAEMEEAMALH